MAKRRPVPFHIECDVSNCKNWLPQGQRAGPCTRCCDSWNMNRDAIAKADNLRRGQPKASRGAPGRQATPQPPHRPPAPWSSGPPPHHQQRQQQLQRTHQDQSGPRTNSSQRLLSPAVPRFPTNPDLEAANARIKGLQSWLLQVEPQPQIAAAIEEAQAIQKKISESQLARTALLQFDSQGKALAVMREERLKRGMDCRKSCWHAQKSKKRWRK